MELIRLDFQWLLYILNIHKQSLLTPSGGGLNSTIKSLWDNLPIFRDSKSKIPVLHVPMSKDLIKYALNNSDFCVNNKCKSNDYFYKVE